jgi:hypothetical protein
MSSYGHDVRMIAGDHFRLSWTVDHKYPSSRQRFPRSHSRDTDEAGAERFAKRWGIENMLDVERRKAEGKAK